jgi:TetR/AcrR family transcriptional repressor of nem operon
MEQTTSEKILDIAQSLVIAGGYNGFSYADISEAVGIRKASIHHHFPTKAELMQVLVDRYTQRARAGLKAIGAHVPDPAGQLRAYLAYWEKCILDASQPFCVCAMLAGEMQMLPAPVALLVQAHFENLAAWLASVLKAGADAGLLRLDKTPEEEADMLMACVHGAMLSARALGNPGLFAAIVGPQLERLKA